MAKKELIRILVAAFRDDISAEEALVQLKQLKRQEAIRFREGAVVSRDEKDRLHIHEAGDVSGGEGASFGALLGAMIGIIGGPAGVVAGAGTGALVGGLTAKIYDAGIADERLVEIGQALTPGTSAVVLILEADQLDLVAKEMQDQGATIFVESLAAQIAAHLSEEKGTADPKRGNAGATDK